MDIADRLLQHHVVFAEIVAAHATEQHGGPDCRMAGERQFGHRREDPQHRTMALVRRLHHEHGFGEIEFARDRLHAGLVETVGFQHHRQRIAGKAGLREHIEGDEAAAHSSARCVGSPPPASEASGGEGKESA